MLRECGAAGLEIPVLMLTAKAEELDKIRGLDLGADDYITKPFSLSELMARIRAVLRRKRRFDKKLEQVAFGRVKMRLRARSVEVERRSVKLTHRELRAARLFLHARR